MERQQRRAGPPPGHPPGAGRAPPAGTGAGGGRGGGRGGDKRLWASPKGRSRGGEEPSPGLSLPPAAASAVFRLDRVVLSDPRGVRRALAALGGGARGPPPAKGAPPPPAGPAPGLPLPAGAAPTPGTPFESRPHPGAAGPTKGAEAPEPLRAVVGGFLAKRRERPPRKAEDGLGFGSEREAGAGGGDLWNRLQTGGTRKAPGEPWMEPLGPFEEGGGTEGSTGDSGVELSGDSSASSASCSQRSSPDGGLKGTPPTGGAGPAPPRHCPPPRDGPAPPDSQAVTPPAAPPDPIGTERSQRGGDKAKAPPEEEPPPPRPPRTPGFPPPQALLPAGGAAVPGGGPDAWAPSLPEGDSRRRSGGAGRSDQEPAGAEGVPSAPVEPPLGTGSSFRPGTPSLTPFRAGPVFVAGAGLPALPLKGPFVEFPPVGGPELAKLGGAGGLLYPPAPPFVYSPPFCPDPPLLQVRQELTPPSDFYGQGGQSSFQQMLLPVVEPPVVNFGGPPGPPAPPLPLLPLGRLVAPPGRPFGPPPSTTGAGAATPPGRPESRQGLGGAGGVGGRSRPTETPPGAPPPAPLPAGPAPQALLRGPRPSVAPPPPAGPRRPPGAWGAPPPPRGLLPPALEPPPPGGRRPQ